MRALMVEELSGPDGLRVADVPAPEDDDKVVVRVYAAGVCFPDLLMTRGQYQDRPALPFVPGCEVAGVVESAPPDAGVRPGDRVAAYLANGGYAELVAVTPAQVVAIPDEVSFETAAGMLVNYHTMHFAFTRRGRLAAGETVLVLGAAGGVGTAAIQLGQALGARVLATVRDDAGERVARAAGAREVVHLGDDLRESVLEATGGRGVDVVADPIGGPAFHDSLRCLAPEGRLLVLGFAAGEIPELRVNRLLLRNASAVGVAWGAFLEGEPDLFARTARALDELLLAGRIDPPIAARYPLADGAGALHDLETRRIRGKSVLTVA